MKKVILSVIGVLMSVSLQVRAEIDQFIVGGVNAKKGEVPFIVSLRLNGEHLCGGSLIDKEWVVTAAHCMRKGLMPDEIHAESLSAFEDKDTKVLAIKKIIPHPDYNKKFAQGSDIALIKIATYNEAKTVRVSNSEIEKYKKLSFSVAGWGDLEEMGPAAKVLNIVEVPYVDREVCEEQFQDVEPSANPYLNTTMFCAGDVSGERDACQGDSGGPIFLRDEATGQTVLTGIVSWGYGCAKENMSGVYTNISKFVDWINTTKVQYKDL